MKSILIFFTALCLIFGCTQNNSADITAIKSVMNAQVAAWNIGNIDGYMQGYWDNDSLLFIGSKGPKYGYNSTLNNYKKSYPDKAAMGELHFSSLKYNRLSAEYYHITGEWSLIRANDNPNGYFTLIFRKIDGSWVIVADHSS